MWKQTPTEGLIRISWKHSIAARKVTAAKTTPTEGLIRISWKQFAVPGLVEELNPHEGLIRISWKAKN